MSALSSCCRCISCGLCGSTDDADGGETWREHREPLLSEAAAAASLAGYPPPPREKKPANTSNMLGLGIRDVTDDYELGELLGEGAFGVVRRCRNLRTQQEFACKTVVKSQLRRRADVEDVRREVQILMMLSSHPNVAALVAIYEDEAAVHMILELCEGGQLFDEICSQGSVSERRVAALFRKMVEVVKHCHTLGIAHRDIKPENFLLTKSGPTGEVKAADFGLSQFFRPGRNFKSLVGSAYFVAPEVLQRNYGPQADIWSLGVCLYILLTGLTPFWGDTEEQIFDMVLNADVDFESEPWPRVSRLAKDVVRKMLQRDPARRPTAQQLLQHAWLNQAAPDAPLGDDVVQRIRAFAAVTKVKRAAMLMAAQGLEDEGAPQIKQIYDELANQTDGAGGQLNADDVRGVLEQRGEAVGEEELRSLMAAAGKGDGDGKKVYAPEFVAAIIGRSGAQREELVRCLFHKFNPSGSGAVGEDELWAVLSKYGMSREDVAKVMEGMDTDKDGQVTVEDFYAFLARNTLTASLQEAVRRRFRPGDSPEKQKRRMGRVDEEEDDDWEDN